MLPAKLVYDMLRRVATTVYTRAIDQIDGELNHERILAWNLYCARLDEIAETARRRKIPHRTTYLTMLADAQARYETALEDLRTRLTTEVTP